MGTTRRRSLFVSVEASEMTPLVRSIWGARQAELLATPEARLHRYHDERGHPAVPPCPAGVGQGGLVGGPQPADAALGLSGQLDAGGRWRASPTSRGGGVAGSAGPPGGG